MVLARIFRGLKEGLRFELAGIILTTLAVLGFVSLYDGGTGAVGGFLKRVTETLFGQMAPAVPALMGVVGVLLLFRRTGIGSGERILGALVLLFVLAAAFHLRFEPDTMFANGREGLGGGLVGALFSWVLLKAFGPTGRYIVLIASALVAVVLLTDVSVLRVLGGLKKRLLGFLSGTWDAILDFIYVGETEDSTREATTKGETQVTIRDFRDGSTGEGKGAGSRNSQKPTGPGPSVAVSPALEGGNIHVDMDGGEGENGGKYEQVTFGAPVNYQLPPVTLLQKVVRLRSQRKNRDITEKASLLEATLENFGVQARVVEVSRGPAITRFEVQPAPGVKVSKIVSLADDIALSLAAPDVRIEAPIPGKAAIGIEVPNQEVSLVFLREVIEDERFVRSESPLTVALGKDISGQVIVGNLEKMLHLLIAGATGSGKSVCLNAIIASILFKARPDQVKFLMIDPKVVELNDYNGIPHLLAPVVTDPKKAAGCLRWAVQEMEHRYELFASAGVRDIERYNRLKPERRAGTGLEDSLPYIVIIIDELADLMMVAAVEVEDAICRLAQMARAAGIHLVVATQRPSVDVITGLIKANIPSRIAFAVSSQVDSRTILDSSGAEKLLGKGDMLFYPVGASKPIRAQGAYISEKELEGLVKYVRNQQEPEFEDSVLEVQNIVGEKEEEKETDELFAEAVRVVVEAKQASASLLQRKLRIGYTRAARLIDSMEERGYVGPPEGSKPREVLLSPEQFMRIFGAG
mgnify:CR=1 FL=1